jgi:hypothetical protein
MASTVRYAVIGTPRGGTSMLMRAIDAGGLPVYRDVVRDDRAVREATRSNPHGYFEPPPGAFGAASFPRNIPNEHAFKMFVPDAWVLCRAKSLFRVAFLRRDPVAVLASYEQMFGRVMKQRLGSHGLQRSDLTPGGYDRMMRTALDQVKAAAGVESVVELTYEAILDNPEHEFGRLVEARWPIDPTAAAAVPSRSLNHA